MSAGEASCPGGCKYQMYAPVFSDLSTAAAGAPFQTVSRCDTAAACLRAPSCEAVFEASGHAALVGSCLPNASPATVRDFADGGKSYSLPSFWRPRLAGDYVAATRTDDGVSGNVVLYDWRAGREVMSIPVDRLGYSVAVQEDGKVVYSAYESDRVARMFWASPAEPSPHPLPVTARTITPLVITGDQISFRINDAFTTDVPEVGVADLAGNVRPTRRDAPSSDFDGHRLIGLRRPCGVAYVVEWDLEGDVPAPPAGPCPAAKVARASSKLNSATRAVKIAVTCPSQPAFGCHGQVGLRSHPAFKRAPLYRFAYYQLEPGETQTFSVQLSWSSLCRPRKGRVTIEARTSSGGLETGVAAGTGKSRFTVTGVKSRPRACGRR